MRIISTFLTAAWLGGCAAPTAEPKPVTYVCDDGTTLTVRFASEMAYVTTGSGTELVLSQQRVASGDLVCDAAI